MTSKISGMMENEPIMPTNKQNGKQQPDNPNNRKPRKWFNFYYLLFALLALSFFSPWGGDKGLQKALSYIKFTADI